MQTLFDHYSQILGITLLHSLWQGLIIYAVLRIMLLSFPLASSNHRCNVALTALAASVIWPLLTLMSEIARHPYIKPVAGNLQLNFETIPFIHTSSPVIVSGYSFSIDRYLPFLVVVWLVGVVLNSAKLYWGWKNLQQLKQNLLTAPFLSDKVREFARQLNITKNIPVYISEHLDVPCLAGYLKPIIIVPASVITQFSSNQIESILIHEMAHIRRNDYLINLLQQVVGIVFFFNPFIYLINRIIHSECENCCDDLVLQVTGEPLVYAQTLLQLEENRQQYHRLALAATGKKYHLLNRIKRIMETKKQVNNIRHILIAAALLVCGMGTIAWLNPDIKNGEVSVKPETLSALMTSLNDTTLKIKNKTIAIKPKSKSVAASKSTKKLTSQSFTSTYSDPELDKLTAEVKKHGEAVGKYFENGDFKKLQEEMEKKGQEIQAYYDKPEIKELQAKQEKLAQEFQAKWGNADEQEALYNKIYALQMKFMKYINTPEYKELDERLQKKYDIKRIYLSGLSNAYMLDNKSKNYGLYVSELHDNTPEDIRKANAESRELEKLRKIDTRSTGVQNRELRVMADSMRKTFNSAQIKLQQQELKNLAEMMRNYQSNPEIKKEQQLLAESAKKLAEYTKSPAFKKRMREMMDSGMEIRDDVPQSERPEKHEKPEQPEKPEAKEKPEN